MSKELRAALNMAKFIQGQSLLLLGRLNELNLDDDADLCEELNNSAEQLYRSLAGRFENLQGGD